MHDGLSRRRFTRTVLSAGAAASFSSWLTDGRRALAAVVRDAARPAIPCGVASGDVTMNSAVVWSRSDRPARLMVEYATSDKFRDARVVRGPAALAEGDFTAKLRLVHLPPGERIFYRVRFLDLSDLKTVSPPVMGSFRTPAAEPRDVKFAWSGDTAGQGFGINPDWGGMKIYEAIRREQPDFFVHSGDYVYADGPIPAEIPLDDGTVWKNVVSEETSKVAETLAEFRGNYKYNLLDEHFRRFNAEVPQYVQWDDHETLNNWYPGETLDDDARYRVKSVSLLAARARRAFLDFTPIGERIAAPGRIYRAFEHGPMLEVILLDQRSYRGPNSRNQQTRQGPETAFLGRRQLAWLKHRLRHSTATWKVICSDMPMGLIVGDTGGRFEALAGGNGPPRGRELELAELLKYLRRHEIRNTVWLTADVHYAAAHYYDPAKAQFTEFLPFWEFVAGPLNAGTFGPAALDNTFGPTVKFRGIPAGMKPNRPPSDGFQFFGTVRVEAASGVMTVALHDLSGKVLYQVELPPA